MIYICRHGETEWSKIGRHTGLTDLGLTDTGKQQALALKKRLQGIQFAQVFSSPLRRARETAELAGFHPQIAPEAREWDYGNYEGKTSDEIGPEWNLFRDGAPGGESPSQVAVRADKLIHLFGPGPVLLFSHGHFLRMLAARWLGLPPEKGNLFVLSTGSLSILGLEKQQKVIVQWNVSG